MGRPVIYQSQRTPAYHAALHLLRQRGVVYPCVCTRKEIAEHARMGLEGLIYPGTCRREMPGGREARTLRLLTAGPGIQFDDAVLGPQTRDLERDAGDFTLYRADACSPSTWLPP